MTAFVALCPRRRLRMETGFVFLAWEERLIGCDEIDGQVIRAAIIWQEPPEKKGSSLVLATSQEGFPDHLIVKA